MSYPQQQLPYGQQPYQQQFRPLNNLKIIPVTNRQEANSTQVDYSGVPIFFYNQTTGEIYKKQFDISTGLATFHEFVKSDKPISNENDVLNSNSYKDELNAIMIRIDGLEETIRKMFEPKGVKNAK